MDIAEHADDSGPGTAVLVTGATGFIGRHVVRSLLSSERRVVILARSRNGLTARQRVNALFGGFIKRVEVVAGDLASASLVQSQLLTDRWKIETMIHCAADTSFVSDDGDQARALHIHGPLALLRMLHDRGLRRWCQVSTAYVCGRRSGIVYEHEGDVGQQFHNAYERLKLASEIRFKQACTELGVDLRIFRPSIVIGAAPATSGGIPSNLFFVFLRLLTILALSAPARRSAIRIQAPPQARFNVVPVEYVARAIDLLAEEPAASGKTFHLVMPNAPMQQMIVEMMSSCLNLPHLRLVGAEENISRPSSVETRIARMLFPYREYLEQDVQFDCSQTLSALSRHSLELPVMDSREMKRLIELARNSAIL